MLNSSCQNQTINWYQKLKFIRFSLVSYFSIVSVALDKIEDTTLKKKVKVMKTLRNWKIRNKCLAYSFHLDWIGLDNEHQN